MIESSASVEMTNFDRSNEASVPLLHSKRKANLIRLAFRAPGCGPRKGSVAIRAFLKSRVAMLVTKFLRFSAFLLPVAAVSCIASTIKGTVTMPDGRPAVFFKVDLIRISANNIDNAVRIVTDQDGRYQATGLPEGEYVLFFYNNTLEYPLRRDMFLDDKPLRLTVGAGERVADVSLPDPAVIVDGIVRNGLVALPQVTIGLCHKGQEWRSGTIKADALGHFRYVVPAHEELSISVITKASGAFTFTPLRFTQDSKVPLELDTSKAVRNAPPCKPFTGN